MTLRKKNKLVYGVGLNDSEFAVSKSVTAGGVQVVVWLCPFYRAWKHMLARCYSDDFRRRRPSYKGCSVSTEWHSFSVFREWMQRQDWRDKQLDKDLLYPGNKIYSAINCVFIPSNLNTFLIDRAAGRGEFPIGVHRNKATGKFRATCNNPHLRKIEWLGDFNNPEDAHEAWRSRKHEHACVYAEKQSDLRVAAALRSRFLGLQPETAI